MNTPEVIAQVETDSGLHFLSGRPELMANFHRHREVELNFVTQGSMKYLLGGSTVEVPENHLAVFWATVPHRVIRLEEQTEFYCMYVPLTHILQWQLPITFTQPLLRGDLILEPDLEQAAFDRALFERWKRDLRDNRFASDQIIFLELEARLRRLARTPVIGPTEQALKKKSKSAAIGFRENEMDKVERMAFYMATHYGEPITISSIAEQVGLHPKYAMTLFRKNCGITLLDYLTQHRLSQSQRLLVTTDLKIVDIAFESGFGSVSRFYEVFERACGKSPRDYRRSFYPSH